MKNGVKNVGNFDVYTSIRVRRLGPKAAVSTKRVSVSCAESDARTVGNGSSRKHASSGGMTTAVGTRAADSSWRLAQCGQLQGLRNGCLEAFEGSSKADVGGSPATGPQHAGILAIREARHRHGSAVCPRQKSRHAMTTILARRAIAAFPSVGGAHRHRANGIGSPRRWAQFELR